MTLDQIFSSSVTLTVRALALLIAVFSVMPVVQASDAIRCGSRLVTVESRAADILAACGEPDFRDVQSYGGLGLPDEIAESERWTYNFGSNKRL